MYAKHGIFACSLRILCQESMFHTFPTPIFALFCVAQMQVSRASVHSAGFWEYFWKTKSKQNDDNGNRFGVSRKNMGEIPK